MSFLWTKKPPFDKTTRSNDKTKVSCTEKWARKIFGTYDQYHGLSIVSSLSLYSILVQHACNDHACLTSECLPRYSRHELV